MEDIAVLIVDDSALMRNLISRIIDAAPGMVPAAKAMNGEIALTKITQYNPDMIVLDLEMPVMTGIEFMRERKKRGIDIPVVILSSIAHRGAAVTMDCLELGASDFILKPSGSASEDVGKVALRLTEVIYSYGGAYARRKGKKIAVPDETRPLSAKTAAIEGSTYSGLTSSLSIQSPSFTAEKLAPVGGKIAAPIQPVRESGPIELIGIGISTGGPNALREVFAGLSPDLPQPIVVVQHMPAGFTFEFAASLNRICPLAVKEAEEGDVLKKGRILIAPGNKHITVEKRSLAAIVHLSDDEPRNGHRPSADVLFESIAKTYQNRALGIIMTGMGRDGAAQLAEMRRQGSQTLGQDAESSIVYGMPRIAFELGAVQNQVPLSQMADAINALGLS